MDRPVKTRLKATDLEDIPIKVVKLKEQEEKEDDYFLPDETELNFDDEYLR
jgi:hypothetical protein